MSCWRRSVSESKDTSMPTNTGFILISFVPLDAQYSSQVRPFCSRKSDPAIWRAALASP